MGVDVGVAGIGFVGADGEHGFIAEVVDAEADGDLEAEVGEAFVEEAPESGGADTG